MKQKFLKTIALLLAILTIVPILASCTNLLMPVSLGTESSTTSSSKTEGNAQTEAEQTTGTAATTASTTAPMTDAKTDATTASTTKATAKATTSATTAATAKPTTKPSTSSTTAATTKTTTAATTEKEPEYYEPEHDDVVYPSSYYIKLVDSQTTQKGVFEFGSTYFALKNSGAKSHLDTTKKFSNSDYSDAASYKFVGTDSAPTFSSPAVTDFSAYDTIVFSVYSEKATGAKLQLRFVCDGTGNGSTKPYVRAVFNISFTGWKTFYFKISDLGTGYSPDISKVNSLKLDKTGWDLTCTDDTVIYLGSIYVAKTNTTYQTEVSLTDSSIYTYIKDRWREQIIGSSDTKATHSTEYQSYISEISDSCKTAWNKYKTTGDKHFGLSITQGKSGDESKIADIYINLYSMAKGYAAVGSSYYHNSSLLTDIKAGLEYAYQNYYGVDTVTSTYGNWWYWDIGIPMRLVKILLVLENDLSKPDIAKYLAPFDYLDKYPSMTAANRIWIARSCLISALLQEDAERILICKDKMMEVFDYVAGGDGFYRDGSFIQHSALAYTGGYGLNMLETLSEILFAFRGSRFDFTEDVVNNHYAWVFDSFFPLVYQGRLFSSVRGREVYRNTSEAKAGYTFIETLARMCSYAPKEYRIQFKALLRSYMLANKTDFVKEASMDLCLIEECQKLYKNTAVETTTPYEVFKVFGNMDRVVQQNPLYAVCLSFSSTRTYKYECINGENTNGWFEGDGMIYIYTDGYDFNYNFFHYMDPYFLPGITRNSETRKAETIDNKQAVRGSSSFVGGVEAGKYGLAVYDHGYGSSNYYTTDNKAKKTYFMFDDEIVCLGSSISDSSGTAVQTIVENRMWRTGDVFSVNGSTVSPVIGTGKSVSAKTMHFTNMGGYYFFSGTSVYYKKVSNSTQFLQIWLSHGTNPTNAKYAYVYLPSASSAETEAYGTNPDVEILSQTDTIHVVREKTLSATGYAFYAAGESNGVKVSKASAVFVRQENGQKIISVSDPSHDTSSLTVTVTLNGEKTVVSKDDNVKATISGNVLTIQVTLTGNVGQTFNVTVK